MKELPKSLAMVCIALWLVLPLANSVATAQKDKKPASARPDDIVWNKALAKVRSTANSTPVTGLIVKADARSAFILTTYDYRADHDFGKPNSDLERLVTLTSLDGKVHKLKGQETNRLFAPLYMQNEFTPYFTLVEVRHEGLKLASVPLAEDVPAADTSVVAVGRYGGESWQIDSPTVSKEIDPATVQPLHGKLVGSNLQQESLLTVHNSDGTLVGMATTVGGFHGGGGFGGGFFSVADPLTSSPISFVSIVDLAEQLRSYGLPISDAAIELQKQRRRISRDAFGRPIQGKNLQITWSDDHKELHGFSNSRGEWAKLLIKEQDDIIPILGQSVGAVILDGKIAGYSPDVGKWDVLTLSPGSKSVPNLSNDVATVRDGKHYYTFAASSGLWTSPSNPDYQQHSVDVPVPTTLPIGALSGVLSDAHNRATVRFERNNAHIAGIRHHVLAAERMLREILDRPTPSTDGPPEQKKTSMAGMSGPNYPGPVVDGPGPGVLPRTIGLSEQQSLSLAKQLRSQTSLSAEDKSRLAELVTESLDQKLQRQREAAASLRKKLVLVEKVLQSREANRERIIERRVEELLDPNVNWKELAAAGNANPNQYGIPSAGTPIGLPRTPHLPLGGPKGLNPTGQMLPNVVGKGHHVATMMLQEAGVAKESIKRLNAGPAPKTELKYTVVDQSPQPNTLVTSNAQVVLKIYDIAQTGAIEVQPTSGRIANPMWALTQSSPTMPTAGAEIVRELIKRRQFAELSAKPLRDMQRRLEDLGPATGLKGDDLTHHEGVARSTRDEIVRQQKNLQNALAEWKTNWRDYEGQLRIAKSTVEKCEGTVRRAQDECTQARKHADRGYQSTKEASAAEAKLELAELWLLQAREQMQVLALIAEDSPHLNPENFDVASLMERPPEQPKAVTPK